MAAQHGVALLPGLHAGLVDAVELQQPTEVAADLLLDMAIPPVGREAVGAVRLLVEGNVVGAFEPDDEIARRTTITLPLDDN